MEAITRILIERGGMLGVAVVVMFYVAARLEKQRLAASKELSDLQAIRVSDAQKTRDEVIAVNRDLVAGLALNTQAMNEMRDAMIALREAYNGDTDDEPSPPSPSQIRNPSTVEADRTSRRRPTRP